MADKLESDIQRMKKEIEQLISRKLPVVAGKYAKQHFQDNFRQGGFVNGGLHLRRNAFLQENPGRIPNTRH
mgnify:CR=1 FL=1